MQTVAYIATGFRLNVADQEDGKNLEVSIITGSQNRSLGQFGKETRLCQIVK